MDFYWGDTVIVGFLLGDTVIVGFLLLNVLFIHVIVEQAIRK